MKFYIECKLEDLKDTNEFSILGYIEDIEDKTIFISDGTKIIKIEAKGEFDLKKGKMVRVFGRREGEKYVLDFIFEVDAPSPYLFRKFLDLMKNIMV